MLNYLFQRSKNSQALNPIAIDKDILKKRYRQLVAEQQIKTDLAQVAVLANLQRLLNEITKLANQKKILPSEVSTQSLYLFGDVGRGKSLLMELFFEACPIIQKRRVHFHNFMLEVHEFVHQWRKKQTGDPLVAFAKHLRRSTWVLCFDEFNVTDIADAMILTRLFNHLFAEGFLFVATSNYHPDDLYEGGLQHALFLPFIARLKQAADILELVAKEDYRLAHTDTLNCSFHIGSGSKANAFLNQHFNNLTNQGVTKHYLLKLQGREVYFNAVFNDILYSSFEELCHRTLGSADYIEISARFNTVFIAQIPQLSLECQDQARRFVTLIDALYENNVKLIYTAAVSVDLLYKEDGVFEFKRTKSRLIEMQSSEYMQRRQSLKK
jgi:cell division protein ZapE